MPRKSPSSASRARSRSRRSHTLARAGRHAAQPGRRELQRRRAGRKRPGAPVGRSLQVAGTGSSAAGFPNVNIDLIAGMVGETWDNWKRQRPPDHRPGARQRDDLSDGAAVQHGLFQGHAGQARSKRRWPIGRPSGPGSIMPSTNCSAAGYGVSSAYTLVKDKREDQLQLSRQSVARLRSVGHRRGQLRPCLGRALSEPARLGRLCRSAGAGRAAAVRAACGRRRISCWSAR